MALIFPGLDANFVIPFLFVLAVVFGILELANVFKGNRAVTIIISLVIAFFAATNAQFTSILFQFLPTVTFFFIAMFFIAFILEIVGLGRGGRLRGDAFKRMIMTGMVLIVFVTIGFTLVPDVPFIGMDNVLIIAGLVLMLMLFLAALDIGPVKGG